MALQMDPERRRKLMELARWHDEWQAKHGVDDVEFVPEDAADHPERGYPTAEAEREYMHRAREILGQDPETGRYREK
ncbi:MAG TPA: hypothetical protein VJT31_29565 [Rugosimonospora sp.]|nr:hypothetical protein [Rugosimonospora sp.]